MHANAGPSVHRRNYRCTRNEMKLNALRASGLVGEHFGGMRDGQNLPLERHLSRDFTEAAKHPVQYRSNVIVIYFAFVEQRTQAFHYLGRTRGIKNGRHRVFQMFRKHFVAKETRFAAPVTLGVFHLGHGGNELEVWILFF